MPRLSKEDIEEIAKTIRTPLQVQMDILIEIRMIRKILEARLDGG